MDGDASKLRRIGSIKAIVCPFQSSFSSSSLLFSHHVLNEVSILYISQLLSFFLLPRLSSPSPPIATLVFFPSFFSSLSDHLFSFVTSHSLHGPVLAPTPHQFLPKAFLQSNLQSQFHSSLLAIKYHLINYTFREGTDNFLFNCKIK